MDDCIGPDLTEKPSGGAAGVPRLRHGDSALRLHWQSLPNIWPEPLGHHSPSEIRSGATQHRSLTTEAPLLVNQKMLDQKMLASFVQGVGVGVRARLGVQ